MTCILLVDDEPSVLKALVRTMREHVPIEDLHIETFVDPFDALSRCADVRFDIVISDFRMPSMNGIEFLHAMKQAAPDTVRMILSASTEFDTVRRAISEAQVFRYLAKPWQVGELSESIRMALLYRARQVESQRWGEALRVQAGLLTPQQAEARERERDGPDLTHLGWGPMNDT